MGISIKPILTKSFNWATTGAFAGSIVLGTVIHQNPEKFCQILEHHSPQIASNLCGKNQPLHELTSYIKKKPSLETARLAGWYGLAFGFPPSAVAGGLLGGGIEALRQFSGGKNKKLKG